MITSKKTINTKSKKRNQLGMNPSTASSRLVKDILFNFIDQQGINCYHCNSPMTREDFSIEHKTPWLDSENPKELYFDLDNISFSHLLCNTGAARRTKSGVYKHPSLNAYDRHGCRCKECKAIKSKHNAKRKRRKK